jgi:microcystin-dependent protein
MATPPANYLKCNGALVSRTTYAALFTAIGTLYGAGDGSTTFALPDLRAEFVRGWDDGRGIDTSRAIGTAQAAQMPAHTHVATSTAAAISAGTPAGTLTADAHTHTGTTASAGAHTHNVTIGSDGGPQSYAGRATTPSIATLATSSAGAHTHTFTTSSDSHTHTFTGTALAAHTHTVTTTLADTGGTSNSSENRPRNVALLYCIKT